LGWLIQDATVFGIQFQLWMPLAVAIVVLAIVATRKRWW
jgi:hypothetical protein